MLIGITISTKYSNLLEKIIHHNQQFFDKWYIVTHETDIATIELVKHANYPNIELMYYDFYANGCNFDKGTATRNAQLKIYETYGQNATVLIIDSDIYLPTETMDAVKQIKLMPDELYGITTRYVFLKNADLANALADKSYLVNIKKENLTLFNNAYGCFQLYLQTPQKIYNKSHNCAECDLQFSKEFTKIKFLDATLPIYHLGPTGINWNGCKDSNDFQ